ncbi:serine carboxypeptidase-like 13 [Ipomoea triloba]|uniref:serine carboxypeptidase-like 13 n=1 Tax=Ipomoea triloba TaxID=35885 RepID=UPI00125DDA04|nr:serine carboxypeptidase-like 13 [Ipomoea triloba]
MCIYGGSTLLYLLLVLELCFPPATVAAGFAIKHLPGYEGPLPFELQTGYIGVGETEEVQLFYYFIKSESNPYTDPLILWLTGGPGCSGLWSVAYDNGPLRFNNVEYNGSLPTLSLNPFAWTKIANIIFLDLPVGTGFSYATTIRANTSDDIQAGIHGCEFVQKWLKEHPNFISNALYVGGESYAGIFVPIITQFISDGIEARITPWINLKGYLLGNPMTNLNTDGNYQIPYAHGMGLISDDLYKSLERHCGGEYRNVDPNNFDCLQDAATFYQWYSKLYKSHILEPACPDDPASKLEPVCNDVDYSKLFDQRRALGQLTNLITPLHITEKCRDHWYTLMSYWANELTVRDAIHVRKGTVDLWEYCHSNLSYTVNAKDVTSYHAYLSTKGYRSLIYSGDHDPCVPSISTQAWIKALNYSIVDDWKPWWTDDQVAGYTMTYSNGMTFATVKGGHTVPESAPYQALVMFAKWIQNGHV